MKHRTVHFIRKPLIILSLAILSSFMFSATQAYAEEPIRYTVKKGDTLWDISEKYMSSPWRWPELWEQNSYINNPHLIYPGDLLLISPSSVRLIRSTARRTVKRQPQIRDISDNAITTIDPNAILPFLNQSVIVAEDELNQAAYIIRGADGEIAIGASHTRFYAANLVPTNNRQYKIFRIGRTIADPDTGTTYGIEGVHLGTAVLKAHNGEVATLELLTANQEITPGDRLVPAGDPIPLPRYFPHKPDTQISSKVIMIPKGIEKAGRRDIVIITGGSATNLEEGHVLDVLLHTGSVIDPITQKPITLPDSKVATAMIFKTYEQVSYAILMNASAPVSVGDTVVTP